MFWDTFKNFTIDLVSPNPTGTFHRGEILSGVIRFELSKKVKIQKISMTVKGHGKVQWTRPALSFDRIVLRTHTGKMVFFHLEGSVLRAETGNALRHDPRGELVLQPGAHVYPFSCQIPQGDFPSTFRGTHGWISYFLIFRIHRRWRCEKTFFSELKFERLVNIGGPAFLRPLSVSDSKIICCCLGEISMDVHMERKGFIPGETIRITAKVANGTSVRIVPKAELIKRETYRARSYQCISKTLNCTTGQPVRPHTSDNYFELTLPIPGDVYTSLENCAILDIQYYVSVSLRAIGGCSKLKVLFPIVIGSACVPVPEVDRLLPLLMRL